MLDIGNIFQEMDWISYCWIQKMMIVHIIEVYATPEISEMADN